MFVHENVQHQDRSIRSETRSKKLRIRDFAQHEEKHREFVVPSSEFAVRVLLLCMVERLVHAEGCF
jgi:hypothetical protein